MTRIHTVSMALQEQILLGATFACRVLVLVLIVSMPAMAQTAKDTVRWDDRTSQWVYTLFNPADLSRSKEVRYTPRTLIEPEVKSKVQWDKDRYEYSYRVKNGNSARQPISDVSIQAPKWDAEAIQHAPSLPNMTWAQIQTKARAEVAAEEAFVAKTLYSPNRWKPFLNVNRPTRVVFGWLITKKAIQVSRLALPKRVSVFYGLNCPARAGWSCKATRLTCITQRPCPVKARWPNKSPTC